MPTASKQEFLTNLKQSDIASDELIALWCDGIADDMTPKGLARHFVNNGQLTAWQAKYLLSGKSKLKFGNYVLLERIKRNEIGDTFVAKQVNLDRNVKIVFLSSALSKRLAEREELLRQVAATANVDHPGLEHLHVIEWESTRYMIVTDFVDAESLHEPRLISKLETNLLPKILSQMADATAVAHQHGLSHGAMTEKDIAVDVNGKVTVCNMVTSFLIQNLSGDDAGPVTKSKEDVAAVHLISKRLLRRFGNKGADDVVSGLVVVVNKMEEGDFGLSQASMEFADVGTGKNVEIQNEFLPSSQPSKSIRRSANAQSAKSTQFPALPVGVSPPNAEYPARAETVPASARFGLVIKVLKGAAALSAIGLVYYAITSGWFETMNSQSSNLDRGSKFDTHELPAVPKFGSDVEFKDEAESTKQDESEAINGSLVSSNDGENTDIVPVLPSIANNDAGEENQQTIHQPLEKTTESNDKPDLQPKQATNGSDSILSAFNSMKSDELDSETSEDQSIIETIDEFNETESAKTVKPNESPSDSDGAEVGAAKAFPKHIDLPNITDSKAIEIGLIGESSPELKLISDQNISKSKIDFQMEGPRNGIWSVELTGISEGQPVPVAEFNIDDQALTFRWLPTAAEASDSQYLANCVLQTKKGSKTYYTNLRQPVSLLDFVIDRKQPQIKLDIKELDLLPKTVVAELHLLDEKVFGQTYLEGDTENRTFSRKQPLVVHFRELPEYQLLHLFLSGDLKNRSKLEASVRLQLLPDQKPRIATERLVEAAKQELEQTILRVKQEHDFLKATPIADLRKHFNVSKQQLKDSHRNERVKLLKKQMELSDNRFKEFREIQSQLEAFYDKPIPVSIYFEVQGQRVVLASSVIE